MAVVPRTYDNVGELDRLSRQVTKPLAFYGALFFGRDTKEVG